MRQLGRAFKSQSQWAGQTEKIIQDNRQPDGDWNRVPHELMLKH